MAFVPSTKSRLLLGDFHLAAYTTDITFNAMTEMLDSTVLTDTAKQFIPGQDTSTLTMSGHHDVAQFTDAASFKTAETPFTYAPSGLAVASEVALVSLIDAGFETSAPVAGMVDWSLSGQTNGRTDFGFSLADLAAVTADADGASHNNGASTAGGAVAHLHVTAFSGFTGVSVIVEDSADDAAWSTIGTFTNVTALTSERMEIAGTIRQYVRVRWDVTGTGSVTAQASYARR